MQNFRPIRITVSEKIDFKRFHKNNCKEITTLGGSTKLYNCMHLIARYLHAKFQTNAVHGFREDRFLKNFTNKNYKKITTLGGSTKLYNFMHLIDRYLHAKFQTNPVHGFRKKVEKDRWRHHLNKLELGRPQAPSSQISKKSVQRFWRRPLLTDDGRRTVKYDYSLPEPMAQVS